MMSDGKQKIPEIVSRLPELKTVPEKWITKEDVPLGDYSIIGHSIYKENHEIKNVIHVQRQDNSEASNPDATFQIAGEDLDESINEEGGVDYLIDLIFKLSYDDDYKLKLV